MGKSQRAKAEVVQNGQAVSERADRSGLDGKNVSRRLGEHGRVINSIRSTLPTILWLNLWIMVFL